MSANENLLVPTFRVNVEPNEAASKAAGRPIFTEQEVVEIRYAGDRQKVSVFPAHEAEPNATRLAGQESTPYSHYRQGEPITYAMVYGEQYRKFKSLEAQDVSGTPLTELPFLTEARRRELRALNIHTAEALAALDGGPLKQIGPGGRELKNQAQAYIDKATGSADVTALAATVASLQQQIKDRDELIQNFTTTRRKNAYQRGVERSVQARAEGEDDEVEQEEWTDPPAADFPASAVGGEPAEPAPDKALEDCTNAELKEYILRETGERVKGNPNHETLIERAREIATAPPKPPEDG